MLTVKDFQDIIEGKIASEAQKAIIRNSVPPQIAEKVCEAIDKNETVKHFERFLKEWKGDMNLSFKRKTSVVMT